MEPGEPEPIPSTPDLIEITYICQLYGTTAKRMIKSERI
jgi:hypothetical protein